MNSKIISGPKEELILPTESFGKIIYEKLQKVNGNLIAFINSENPKEFLTYANILVFSKNLSINLRNLRIGTNDVIGIVAANSIYYPLPMLAGFYLGAPIHLIDSNCTEYELRHLLKISKPKIIFCSKSSFANVQLVRKEFNIGKLIVFDETHNDVEDVIEFQELIRKTNGDCNSFQLANDFDPIEHLALVLNSSGTTGLPKGAMLTHENLQKRFDSWTLDIFSYKQPDSGICTVPLCHGYGFYICFGSLLSYSKLIIMNKFKSELFFELIQNFRIKKLFLVPTLINLMVNSSKTEGFNLSSVEEVCSTACPLSANLAEFVTNKFNLKKLYDLYGSAECGLVAISYPTKFFPNFSQGHLFPRKLLKITDLNTNEPLGSGEFGEICVKNCILKGYMNDEKKTRESIDDEGFFHTGDAGYYDEKCNLYITDRIKDIIKYKSFHFSPIEVEEVLLRHPAVEDAAIVGKPDNFTGELPIAFIVRKAGFEVGKNEIVSYVAKFFSEQKHLHGGVRFVEKIPRNFVGKIRRNDLKKLLT